VPATAENSSAKMIIVEAILLFTAIAQDYFYITFSQKCLLALPEEHFVPHEEQISNALFNLHFSL
jgi:hypothetical protein